MTFIKKKKNTNLDCIIRSMLSHRRMKQGSLVTRCWHEFEMKQGNYNFLLLFGKQEKKKKSF